jgi:hypothetical protein
MNGGCQVKEILNLIIVKSSQSTDRLFYKVDRHKGRVSKWLCLFLFHALALTPKNAGKDTPKRNNPTKPLFENNLQILQT